MISIKKILSMSICSLVALNSVVFGATGQFGASIELLSAITVTEKTAMDFGKIMIGSELGTITIGVDGAISGTGGYVGISADSTLATQAIMDITGSANESVSLALENASITLTGTGIALGETLTLGTFVLNPTGTTTLSETGTAAINIGGTVSFAAGQKAGPYAGTNTLIVNYN